MCVCPHSVEVMDYIGGVAASKVRHGHSDLLIVVGQVDADIFLQLLTPTQRGIHRVFIQHPAVEQVLLRDLHKHTNTHTQINIHINTQNLKNMNTVLRHMQYRVELKQVLHEV